jgi:hypothetical protein
MHLMPGGRPDLRARDLGAVMAARRNQVHALPGTSETVPFVIG